MILQIPASEFSLRDTLECGQAFRWRSFDSAFGLAQHIRLRSVLSPERSRRAQDRGERALRRGLRPCSGRVLSHVEARAKRVEPRSANGWYYGFLPARPESHGVGGPPCAVKVRQDNSTLTVETADSRLTHEHIRHYFALDVDLLCILSSIDVDALVHEAIGRFRGLRILRQDPWECLASFVCSSYNNIKRIQGMIERLCQAFGTPVAFNGFRGVFAFPTPEVIANASEHRLRALGLGFRAPYLKATARLIADGKLSLEMLRRTDYWVTKSALLHCEGVGDKVADCVALFGLQKYEAFPIDLWIERAMRYYFRKAKMTPRRIHEFAHRHFGRYAGYAQQYLYHYVRNARLALSSKH